MPRASDIREFFTTASPSPVQCIMHPLLEEKAIELYVKRDDLLDSLISGNKWRKLKYNLIAAAEQGFDTLLSFGGAHSNHIHALAAASEKFGFKCVGVIRAHQDAPLTPTLEYAKNTGMHLHFVSRDDYRRRSTLDFIEKLKLRFGGAYVIPEGGSNTLALNGCAELMDELFSSQHLTAKVIALPCGTGGTLAGLLSANKKDVRVIGFPVLKDADFLYDDIRKLLGEYSESNWDLQTNYHFGGYAKINQNLISFMDVFFMQTGIALDPVYTGKMFYGLFDMIVKDQFPRNCSITAIHTGGLQGVAGMQDKIKRLEKVNNHEF